MCQFTRPICLNCSSVVGIGTTKTCALMQHGLATFLCPELQWKSVATVSACGLCPDLPPVSPSASPSPPSSAKSSLDMAEGKKEGEKTVDEGKGGVSNSWGSSETLCWEYEEGEKGKKGNKVVPKDLGSSETLCEKFEDGEKGTQVSDRTEAFASESSSAEEEEKKEKLFADSKETFDSESSGTAEGDGKGKEFGDSTQTIGDESSSTEEKKGQQVGDSVATSMSYSSSKAEKEGKEESGMMAGRDEMKGMLMIDGYLVDAGWEKKRQKMIRREQKKWSGLKAKGAKRERFWRKVESVTGGCTVM